MFKTQDLHVREIVRLSSPRVVKSAFPPTPEATATVAMSRERITRILQQEDPRLLVVVGQIGRASCRERVYSSV